MARKKKEPVFEEQDIIITPIPGYEDTYGITDDGIVYDIASECAIQPTLDDLGRPCVKLHRELIPLSDIKAKLEPPTPPRRSSWSGYRDIYTGHVYKSIEDIMSDTGVSRNTVAGKIKLGIYMKG